MKIALINFSGNVGKSTIARHLLAPRMNNASPFPVETINSDGSGDAAARGKDFVDVMTKVIVADDAIIDIGSSNVEAVIQVMAQNPGMHEDIDLFVVPVVPSMKQQRDTISTIEALADLGVPAKKIRTLFNLVELGDKAENVFAGIFEYHKEGKKFTLKSEAVLHANPIFPKFASTTASISEVAADPTDCKAKIAESKDPEEKLRYAQLLALKRGAAGAIEELDAVFKAVVK